MLRIYIKTKLFQFTPLREGRPSPLSPLPSPAYFNSRPSARGDQLLRHAVAFVDISIHAPPRGATMVTRRACGSRMISIHAPPRGATGPSALCRPPSQFQFTPLREGRHGNAHPLSVWLPISIHAPPRGATIPALPHLRSAFYFNSRPSARGDTDDCYTPPNIYEFQFTPLREGRRWFEGC